MGAGLGLAAGLRQPAVSAPGAGCSPLPWPLGGEGHSGRLGKGPAAFHNAAPVRRHRLIRTFACDGLGSLGKQRRRRGWQRAARVPRRHRTARTDRVGREAPCYRGHRSARRRGAARGMSVPPLLAAAGHRGGFGAGWERRQRARRPTSRLRATSPGQAGGAPKRLLAGSAAAALLQKRLTSRRGPRYVSGRHGCCARTQRGAAGGCQKRGPSPRRGCAAGAGWDGGATARSAPPGACDSSGLLPTQRAQQLPARGSLKTHMGGVSPGTGGGAASCAARPLQVAVRGFSCPWELSPIAHAWPPAGFGQRFPEACRFAPVKCRLPSLAPPSSSRPGPRCDPALLCAVQRFPSSRWGRETGKEPSGSSQPLLQAKQAKKKK